jgi:hypothetical protein
MLHESFFQYKFLCNIPYRVLPAWVHAGWMNLLGSELKWYFNILLMATEDNDH